MTTRKAKRSESRRGDSPVRLAAGVEKSLSAYATAATAAGVSLLALTPAANAKIVYTPADTSIPIDQSVLVDLNHDGIADFAIGNFRSVYHLSLKVGCATHTIAGVSPPKGGTCNYQTNQMWGRGMFPSALPAGFKVRPNKSYFQPGSYLGEPMVRLFGGSRTRRSYSSHPYSNHSFGQWQYTKNRYLGLQFVIKGQVHYGWARLTVTSLPQPASGILAILTGYAYETEANTPIITGKTKGPDVITLDPATLGHLAGGASQIPAWRGERNRARALEDSRQKAGQGSPVVP
jgi:hypothetical protein